MSEPTVATEAMSIWVPVIAALGSSFLTGLVSVLIHHINKKNELEKIRTQVMITAGIESWKTVIDAHKGQSFSIPPMESYILHMHQFATVLFDPTTNEKNIQQRLEQLRTFSKEANEHWKPSD